MHIVPRPVTFGRQKDFFKRIKALHTDCRKLWSSHDVFFSFGWQTPAVAPYLRPWAVINQDIAFPQYYPQNLLCTLLSLLPDVPPSLMLVCVKAFIADTGDRAKIDLWRCVGSAFLYVHNYTYALKLVFYARIYILVGRSRASLLYSKMQKNVTVRQWRLRLVTCDWVNDNVSCLRRALTDWVTQTETKSTSRVHFVQLFDVNNDGGEKFAFDLKTDLNP